MILDIYSSCILIHCVELEDSISGSASSSSEDEESDAVETLVNKTKLGARAPSPIAATPQAPRTPLAWFHSPPSTQIGVYKALFSDHVDPSSYLQELQNMQKPAERTWAVFMTAGGHFAGAVVRVSSVGEEGNENDEIARKRKVKKPKPDIEVLRHKTFHRYTSKSRVIIISSLD